MNLILARTPFSEVKLGISKPPSIPPPVLPITGLRDRPYNRFYVRIFAGDPFLENRRNEEPGSGSPYARDRL